MSEYQIIRFCAPTLAGLKTASLFCCDAPDEAELLGQLRHWNTSLAPKGLRMLPLRIWNGRALIYLYRPKALARDLACEDAACLLNGSGYDGTEPSGCLRCLMPFWKIPSTRAGTVGIRARVWITGQSGMFCWTKASG